MTHKNKTRERAAGLTPAVRTAGVKPAARWIVRGGFSLIELVIVMVLLTFLLSVLATTVWSTIRIERTDSKAFERSLRHSAIGDQFRADVANAARAPRDLGEHKAGPQCLILAQADGSHVIYALKNKRMERMRQTKEDAHSQPLGLGEDWTVEFATAPGLITMRLIDLRHGTPMKHPVEYHAALGGDVK